MDWSFLSGVMASPWNIFRAILDISIVSYIFYRLLSLIKGSRAEQILKGLFILLVFAVVASYLRLDMVNWLLDKLWIVFAITLPIVFQPELRRFLEKIGTASFFARSANLQEREAYENIIEEISDAVSVLSRTRTGALIVLARETGINDYTETGIMMDSLVSSGLLINIFIPNTPLHDGAVIIKDGRIKKAACFLPLSVNPYLHPELGTRHRAGLGITELSDALAVIVSEEDGGISLANGGKLTRYLDAQSLQELLEKELIIKVKRDSFWRRWASDGRKRAEGE